MIWGDLLALRILLSLLTAISTGALANAWADESSRLSLHPDVQRGDIYRPQGLWPLLGVGMGVMDSADNIRSGGVPTHVKIVGSYYFDGQPWVADLGLGLHNQFLTQKGGGSDTITSLYTEVAGRYELTNKWQVGAIWNTLVDNPQRYRSNNRNLASWAGVQVLKEFTWNDKYLVRAGGRAMTDVGISGDTLNTVMAELQVSFGSDSRVAAVEPAPVYVLPPEPEPELEPAPVAPHLAERAMLNVPIEPGPMRFESDSVRLVSFSKPYLRRLAQALAANGQLFDHVEVVGHTDQRGGERYNDKLSIGRARQVARTLTSAGLQKKQIGVVGKGKSELLTRAADPGALARNRRVELRFHGVKNKVALKNIIDSVKR